jgi:hypothetical protein
LVSTFGLGRGFSRGRIVVGLGSVATGPWAEDEVGREKRVERRDWVEVSVRERRWGLRFELGASLGHEHGEEDDHSRVLFLVYWGIVECGQQTGVDLDGHTSLENGGGAKRCD